MNFNREQLIAYLRDTLAVEVTGMDDTTALFSSGLVDSFSLINLISFVEREAGIRMSAWEVTLDHLDSIERILNFVRRKQGGV